MKKSIYTVVLLCTVVSLSYYLLSIKKPAAPLFQASPTEQPINTTDQVSRAQKSLTNNKSHTNNEMRSMEPQQQPAGTTEVSPFNTKVKQIQLLSTQDYREEVEKDPHITPHSLINSGLRIGAAYDATTNSSEASRLMKVLQECAQSSQDSPVSLKATCLQFARRVKNKFPTTKELYEEALSRADDHTHDLFKYLPK